MNRASSGTGRPPTSAWERWKGGLIVHEVVFLRLHGMDSGRATSLSSMCGEDDDGVLLVSWESFDLAM
jgi:hypothetical protein